MAKRRGSLVTGAIVCGALAYGVVAEAGAQRLVERHGRHDRQVTLVLAGSEHGDRPGTPGGGPIPQGTSHLNLQHGTMMAGAAPSLTWAVWPRLRGDEFDLVWTRWTGAAWQPEAWIAAPDEMGDDLDANLRIDVHKRPHITWWRNEGGIGRIYFSMFLETHWMAPLAVSEHGVDSRHPKVIQIAGTEISILYSTPAGLFTQTVSLSAGVGITDDIDPLGDWTVDAPQHVQQHP